MPNPPTSTWPSFHIAIVNKSGGTAYRSFPSTDILDGDADKITLQKIREVANISEKLKFTADGETLLGDETSLSYYMSLKDINVKGAEPIANNAEPDGENGQTAGGPPNGASQGEIPVALSTTTVKLDLILGTAVRSSSDANAANGGLKGPTLAETVKFQDSIDKLAKGMAEGKNAVKLGDLTRLSATLGALKIDSMNFAASAGKDGFPEPIDLTEQQWDQIFRNNRALHGWCTQGSVVVKARKRAFNLFAVSAATVPPPTQNAIEGTKDETKKDGANVPEPQKQVSIRAEKAATLPPIPPFYVFDDSSVEATEMRNAKESHMAKQGFSSVALRAFGGGGAQGVNVTGGVSTETEHSEGVKQINASEVNSVQVSYKFPRAVVELDSYCLELTDECKEQAKSCKNIRDADKWVRDFGDVFATQFTLGGELNSTRLFKSKENGDLSAFKDSVKVAAGLSLSTPVASGGGSYASSEGQEGSQGERKAAQSARLAWEARGGDTLLCSNPPLWASTVKNHQLWRIMEQQQFVNMKQLVKSIHPQCGDFLVTPETASKRARTKTPEDPEKAQDDNDGFLRTIIFDNDNRTTKAIKSFYESEAFVLDEYNKLLDVDEVSLQLGSKIRWSDLDNDQKICVGELAIKNKVVSPD